jgi:amino acid transporter
MTGTCSYSSFCTVELKTDGSCRIGFRYWKEPYGPFGTYLTQVNNEKLSTFLGFWAVMTNALFAYIGTELVGVTVGEAENPRKVGTTRIGATVRCQLIIYLEHSESHSSYLLPYLGLLCWWCFRHRPHCAVEQPSPVCCQQEQGMQSSTLNSPFVQPCTNSGSQTGAAASPFVVATTLVGIKVIDHIINAAVLIFVLSAANSDLYIGSRTLYGLALEGRAPAIFKRVNGNGVPWPALMFCLAFCCLVFLNVAAGASKVFGYFVNLVSTFGALTWMCLAYTHIRWMKALKAQGISRDDLPYKAPGAPYLSWFALIATGIITFFKGFDTLVHPFNLPNFITSYIGIP